MAFRIRNNHEMGRARALPFRCHHYATTEFNNMQTEKSMEVASLTAPRPERMHVDRGDGFGGWSVELQAAQTS